MGTQSKRRSSPAALVVRAVILVIAVVGGFFLPRTRQSAGTGNNDLPLSLQMFDVGNADCLMLRQGPHVMLIDAGEADTANEVVQKLHEQGVERLETVIATHPHADHIGGMAAIIEEFPIERFIMRGVPESLTPTSAAYRRMLQALDDHPDIEIVDADDGGTYALGDAQITVYPLLGEYNDLNNYSIVCRAAFGDCSYLLMGDAEEPVEEALLAAGYDLSASLLKVGHHGSSTSTGEAFLEAVHPSAALIPCGAGNSYGHPHEETIRKLEERDISVYRSDLNGDIAFATDGKQLIVSCEKQPEN